MQAQLKEVTTVPTHSYKSSKPAEMLHTFCEPIREFLRDNSINEIAINKPQELWTYGNRIWTRHEAPKLTLEHCLQLADLIAGFNGASLADYPVAEGELQYGERVEVIIPPACTPETVSFTIRRPSVVDKTLEELDAEGSFDDIEFTSFEGLSKTQEALLQLKEDKRTVDFLDLAVKSKQNIMVVGKTGSGKTTISKSIIARIPSYERIITIEDVHELKINNTPNKVHLFYKQPKSAQDKTTFTAKKALIATLRMFPDRIMLAECRGDETWDYVKSLESGHAGSISTAHAGSAIDAFETLLSKVKDSESGAHLDSDFVLRKLHANIDVVLFYSEYKLREVYYNPEHAMKLKRLEK